MTVEASTVTGSLSSCWPNKGSPSVCQENLHSLKLNQITDIYAKKYTIRQSTINVFLFKDNDV